MGRGGGASGWGAKMRFNGGVVWLASLRRVAIIDRPANDLPAKLLRAAVALSGEIYLTYTRPTQIGRAHV